jgi:hypothetical protein
MAARFFGDADVKRLGAFFVANAMSSSSRNRPALSLILARKPERRKAGDACAIATFSGSSRSNHGHHPSSHHVASA